MELSGPYGESHMKEDDREIVFLIGGAGASFGRSHIMDLFYGKNTKRRVTLWYGARSMKENIYGEEFEKLAEQFENFEYRLVLSEPQKEDFAKGWPKDDPTKTGFAATAFKKGQLENMDAPEDALYYICGPPQHNQSVLKLLYDFGVDKETSVILDDFGN
ncbi:MAG: Na(+)-translocating NADH-quinone reductase subunit F [Chlamydiia bacterium]|nr:Na(+)-translocating NADH-quinone reductase subunit F [Chlamydiia bacterium]